MTFSNWPSYSKKELNEVNKIISSGKVNYWTNKYGKKFEESFAKFFGCKYAVAVANGSIALDIALDTLNIKNGDEVIVTPRSYVASASCIVKAGAKPIFVDVDSNSQNITAENILKKINKKTKAIICVHLAGWPCEMVKILKIAKQYNIRTIEDCSQAHGAEINGKKVGSFGDIATFSFCNDKIISTLGEGGMITTSNKKLWSRIWSLKEHGKNFQKTKKKTGNNMFKWHVDEIGSNYRLTEIQSAVGIIQLLNLKNNLKKRELNANKLITVCNKIDCLRVPPIPKNIKHAYYRFYVFLNQDKIKKPWNQKKIIEKINNMGVPCFSGSCPEIYRERAFIDRNLSPKKRLKNAETLGKTSIAFLIDHTISKIDIDEACIKIKKVFDEIQA